MKNLIRVIGPAPSELSLEDFKERLEKERDRVRKEIALYQMKHLPSGKKRRVAGKSKVVKEVGDLLQDAGLTPEDLQKMIQEKVKQCPSG